MGVGCSFGYWQRNVNAIRGCREPGRRPAADGDQLRRAGVPVSKEFLLGQGAPRLIALANDLETSLGNRALNA